MRRLLLGLAAAICLPWASAAQIVPKVALFGGYTYVRAAHNRGLGFNLSGWDASLEGKSASWLGWVMDISQQYGSPSGVKENQTSALFGPQISIPHLPRVLPLAHALFGVVRGTNNASLLAGRPCPGPACPLFSTGTTLAAAVGGGLDVKIAGPLWIRALQVDYLHANLAPDHHTQARLASGIVLRFGA